MQLHRAWWILTITLTAAAQAQNLPMPGKPSDDLGTSKVFDETSLPVTHNPVSYTHLTLPTSDLV